MSPNSFRARIRESLGNQALQDALDANAERRVKGRLNAFASLPDWRERRRRAHAVRAEVIENLDSYLEAFVHKVKENGITVHRAKDAAEANQIILDIVGAKHTQSSTSASPLLIAKSKSMVTEEIGLNHALEEAGHRVVETDLGEYIIQLREERPSHIITPSVHLRRHEVGELFHEKLNTPYTEDISSLTHIAREELRQVFLAADVGVSGVNFGVADTGTLTLVTNEGNGRMVTTLPPVHIAVMGMERLVRNLDDLSLMLSLLPRSATTQKISVYTQLIHAPVGSQQKHLLIIDNGRSNLHSSSLREILYCIRCGACLNACPVFREIGGHGYLGTDGSIAPYPGPIGSVVSPGLMGENYFQLAQASSLCGACKDACPVDIDLPVLLTRVRAGQSENGGNALPGSAKSGLRIYTRIATRPNLFALSQRLAGLGALIVSPFSKWIRFPKFTGWGYSKDFPRPAAKPFRARFSPGRPSEAANPDDQKSSEVPVKGKPPISPHINLVGRFAEELLALGGHVLICKEADLTAKIISLLEEKHIARLQSWEKIPGLDIPALSGAGISVQGEADEHIRAGITGSTAAIAETGTLVVQGGQGLPLTASLLPEIHLAVLRASDILENLDELWKVHKVEDHPSVVLISGPSRTADIEMTLTIGVHGPGELHVFVIN